MALRNHRLFRLVQLWTGWLLFAVVAPLISPIPGPGGTVVAAFGAILILRNSRWARRKYVLLKLRWPRIGGFIDRILMRGAAKRRRERTKTVSAN